MIEIGNFVTAVADAVGELCPNIPVVTEFQPQKTARGHLFVDFVSVNTEVDTDETMAVTLVLRIDAVFPSNVQAFASRAKMATMSSLLCGALTGWELDVGEQIIPITATQATGGNGDWVPILLTLPYFDDLVLSEEAETLMQQYSFEGDFSDE